MLLFDARSMSGNRELKTKLTAVYFTLSAFYATEVFSLGLGRMALRKLQAALLAERDTVLSSLDLKYAGPALPAPAPNPKRRREGTTGSAIETPLVRRRSSRVAGVPLADEVEDRARRQAVDEYDDEGGWPRRPRALPRRVHIPQPIGAGELHVMLQLTKGRSDKFYEITTSGCIVITRNGRRGQAGVVREKTFETSALARRHFSELESAKRKKGYGDGNDGSEEGAVLVPLGRWTL
jgi:predicted DNA-binding WGR domain protein